ncbi:MAG: NAD(P)/FAD-dependent oxidoreductase [Bariatricus sp.]
MRYAIVGFGCAGYHCAQEIRKLDADGEIVVFSSHSEAPYNPMLTTYYAGGILDYRGMFPFGSLDEIASRLRLNVKRNTMVSHVLGASREILLNTGEKIHFDRILIASGARAWAPSIPGLRPEKACFMRTLDDACRLREILEREGESIRTAVVVGASMVGIKVVELLNRRGIHTVLADLAPSIFPLAAYADVAEEIENRVEKAGVELAFECTIASVQEKDKTKICRMTDGREIQAQLIVLCIGTRAETTLVDSKEIQVNRGIVVNDAMETSCPGIYAAGDCCEGKDMLESDTKIIGLWANAGHQGGTAGHSMAGQKGTFDGNILHNITHFMGMDFVGMGDNRKKGKILTCGHIAEGMYIKAVVADGRLEGVNILDNYRISGAVKNYFYVQLGEKERRTDISPLQRGLLVKEGVRPSFLRRLEEELK